MNYDKRGDYDNSMMIGQPGAISSSGLLYIDYEWRWYLNLNSCFFVRQINYKGTKVFFNSTPHSTADNNITPADIYDVINNSIFKIIHPSLIELHTYKKYLGIGRILVSVYDNILIPLTSLFAIYDIIYLCFFSSTADQAALPYFYGPVAVILLSNLVIFFLTSRAFAKHYDKLKDVTRELVYNNNLLYSWNLLLLQWNATDKKMHLCVLWVMHMTNN